MQRSAALLLGVLCAAPVLSADLLECVEPDVLSGLVFRSIYDESAVITDALPAEMASVQVPNGFLLIGSLNARGPLGATVAYRTASSPEAARSAAISTLERGGWERKPQRPMMSGPFVDSMTREYESACLDDLPVSIGAYSIDGITYAIYTFSTPSQNSLCRQSAAMMTGFDAGMTDDLPTLRFPADPVTGMPIRVLGGGGGGNPSDRRFDRTLRTTMSVSEISRDLSRQMSEQGWITDADWSGMRAAGSTWTYDSPTGSFAGTLQVLALDENFREVDIHIVRRDTEGR